jgi:hypothetical protein
MSAHKDVARRWPLVYAPGTPDHPERDGWHWMRWPSTEVLTIGQWTADLQGWSVSYLGTFALPADLAHLDYVEPAVPPKMDWSNRPISEHATSSPEDEIAEPERAKRLLPAWFVARMMGDARNFAFLMATGDVVHFENILDVHQATDGSLWVDVALVDSVPMSNQGRGIKGRHIVAPVGRKTASINVAHIVMAFEAADT